MKKFTTRSCDLTLFDNPKNRKKFEALAKLELMVDDCDNDNEGKTKEFFDSLDDDLEWGKTYKLTIEKI